MCAHVREQTRLTERFTLCDVANMHFDDRHFAFLYGIPQRHARMTVPAGIEYDTVSVKGL